MIIRIRSDTGVRRRGITLLEVLTAIFIMGVGLLAILTLFPLGALSMARAVRDDRAAAASGNASSLATAFDLRNDPPVVAAMNAPAVAGGAFKNPDPDGPSYPVLVDPLYASKSSSLGASGTLTPGIKRVSPSYAGTNPRAIARWFTFQDEIVFEKTGQPIGGGTNVDRPGTYSWTYLVRRPRSSSPAMTEVLVFVYAGRPTDSVGGEFSVPNAGNVGSVTGAMNSNTVTLTFSGDRPNFRKGGWIIDTTYATTTKGGTTYGTVNGDCYQVASVTDTGATSMTLELETPLKANVTALVLLENVITVLDRGASWKP